MNFATAFTPERLQEAWDCLINEFPFAIWETVYSTLLATLFAVIIGLPLGVLLVTGEKKGIRPLPAWLMGFLNVLINLLRSIPFIILMVMIIPLTRAIVGTSLGTVASIVPLTIAAFPFIARLVESSLREVNPNIIEHHAGDHHDHGLHGHVRRGGRRRPGQAGAGIRLSAVPVRGAVPGGDRAGADHADYPELRYLAGGETGQEIKE